MARAFTNPERALLRSPDLQVNVLATFYLDGGYGPEKVTNGDFSTGGTGWTLPAGWAVSGGRAQATNTVNGITTAAGLTPGVTYRITFDYTMTVGTKLRIENTGIVARTDTLAAPAGNVILFFTADGSNLTIKPDVSMFSGSIDNISVVEHFAQVPYRFCDEQSGIDLSDGVNTYIGANAFAEAAEIRATAALQAEQVTLLLDGNRMAQAGVDDPARVLHDILGYLYQQRRVDYAFAFRYSYSTLINMIVPAYAGKINTARLLDKEMDFPADQAVRAATYLEITLDSLAARYSRATFRLRAHNDQLEIDPLDQFYSHTVDVVMNERTLFWGKASPFGAGSAGAGGSGGGSGGFFGNVRSV